MAIHVLGLSAYYHDSAACLLRDGSIVAAAQEERFSRKKGDAGFPEKAVEYCLEAAGIRASELNAVAYYDKPVLSFTRLLQSFLEFPFSSFALFKQSIPLWLQEKLDLPRLIRNSVPGFDGEIFFSRHHESHAASAFFCSPFDEAAIVVVDGVGEWACTSIGEGSANSIKLLKEVRFPHSLGLFYSAMTQYLGFRVNFDEYKVMGLAPYGKPSYANLLLDNVIDLKPDGSIELNLEYFDFVHGLRMVNERLGGLTGHRLRESKEQLTEFHMDFAASVQSITQEAMLRLAKTARRWTGRNNLCLAGGVALNCVANGAIYREQLFDDLYVQPAAGDAGGAIGAALQVWYGLMNKTRVVSKDMMAGAYLGPEIKNSEVVSYLRSVGAEYTEFPTGELPGKIARWLASGYIVGLCQGRMEFGPRALGARSILGDPRHPENQTRINLKIKYRESFRPFAPAVLEDKVQEYFDLGISSPYMLLVMPIKDEQKISVDSESEPCGLRKLRVVRSHVPAVTHVDYSVRIQTVTEERNGFFYRVVEEFYKLTGCPMIVNTSFNLSDEPIVCDHVDAHWCFLMSDIDVLVLGTCVTKKPGVDLDVEPCDSESSIALQSLECSK